ncbi:uncharacterized protein LOC141632222 [Silene latifolia]|uniref:uncharacterized protein LOC141632222 n=1 Tax=Silene latifolia TaxID=37657 RepID=UPI003D788A2E
MYKGDDEEGGNSDELRSLQGSDDEIDSRPTFNPDIDFKRKVTLSAGLKFPDADVLRKALVHHAIENRYDFYYLHSARDRISTYCRYRCKCELDKVRCKIVGCKCPKKSWCPFKIYATKQKEDTFWEITTMNLRHTCEFTGYTRKVTSEYLAERYLEDWRENPTWKLSVFQKRVFRELGIEVKYGVCWLARARAKLMIFGDGADQYARVWDYVAALLKYNPGSTAIVMVDNIERPPPIFQRMYICFKAVKDGFLAGCRPLVGVDGFHLKGAYPGMCLVAVGKDGNNNIYPIAWAVVEVENGSTWSWFLKLLVEDVGKEEGEGLTFMSDRQKGLVDALKLVTPKAEVRYCVRHIWANFKLQFTKANSTKIHSECKEGVQQRLNLLDTWKIRLAPLPLAVDEPPCPHAIACIVKNRGNPIIYVDEAYSKVTYLRAYGHSISPMPGVKQWDRVGLDEPVPPPYRKLPGRPNQKKRRKEAGEGTSQVVKRPRRQRACGNCGVLGHNTKTCKNPTMSKENNQTQQQHDQQPRVARAKSKSEWSKKTRENIARRKAQKEMISAMAASIIQESQASVNVLDL